MPFSAEQFMDVFRKYNNAVYPMQLVLFILAGVTILLIFNRHGRNGSKWISLLLSLFWTWMGVFYHLLFFSTINKAAYLFGLLFILQGILFFYFGFVRHKLVFHFEPNKYGITGLVIIFYALILYPVFGYLQGHIYPSSPTFGLPCPTTIFTFGILLWTQPKFPKGILVIPFLWSIVGLAAAFSFGMKEDLALILCAIGTTVLILLHGREYKVMSSQ